MRQGEVPQTLPPIPALDGELSELPSDRLSEITALDARAFGSDRSRVLALLSADASISILSRGGEVVGYSMRREFGRGFVIGPVVARNDQDAVHLTAVHLKKLAGRFVARRYAREGWRVCRVSSAERPRDCRDRDDNVQRPPLPEPGKQRALGLWIGRPRPELKHAHPQQAAPVDQSARQTSGAMRLPSRGRNSCRVKSPPNRGFGFHCRHMIV